jgi:hypothetical protein
MADKKIRLIIQAETKKAVQALNKVEKEQKDIKKQNDKLKGSFAMMGRAIVAAFSIQVVSRFIQESIKLGSQMVSLERSFRNLGKGVGFNEQSLEKFRKATDGTVSDVNLMIQANNAMLLGIVESDEQFADLIDNAQRLSKAVGQDALFGIESLTTGIGRQSKLMLDNLGIIIDTNLAYEKFAEANGKAVKDLDENERKQAFIQAAMESTREKVEQLGDEELDATDATNKLSISFENLKGAIGKDLQGEVKVTTDLMTDLLDGLNTRVEEDGFFFTFLTRMSGIGLVATELGRAVEDTIATQKAMAGVGELPVRIAETDPMAQAEAMSEAFGLVQGNYEGHLLAMADLDNLALEVRTSGLEAEFFVRDAFTRKNEDAVKRLRKEERDAHREKIKNNLEMAILSGQSSKEAALSVIKAEIAEAQAGLISSIMQSVPFPLNLALAGTAGRMIGKYTDELLSFETGGSIITKGRTTLPIGSGVVAGDNASGMERIDFTPLPSPTSNGNNITINISAPLVDETVVETIIPAIRRAEKLNL